MLPPTAVVYLPSERVRPGDETAQLVLRDVPGDGVVLPAYSSLEALVRCCGDNQAWVALTVERTDALAAGLGVVAVVLDTPFAAPEPAS
ncbi:MAG: SAV_915 family protein [Actinomycetes bacterium]